MNRTYKDTKLACYIGYITQAITVNLAPVLFIIFNEKFNISLTLISQLILTVFVIQIFTDMGAVKLVPKIGYRRAAVLAHITATIGLLCLGILPQVLPHTFFALLVSVAIYAFGSGLIEVLISPIVDALPSDGKAGSMSLLHSFYSWGQMGVVLLSTVFLKLFGNNAWFLLPILWALVPFFNIFNFLSVPLPDNLAEYDHEPVTKLLSKTFLLSLLLMICAGAAEQIMSQWASLFAQKGLQVSKITGDILGPCLFAFFMALGRTYFGVKGDKINLKKALAVFSCLCIACYATVVFSPNAVVALLACALTGFSVSLFWPGVLSFTSARIPTGGTAMFAVLAIFGDVGCSLGPWLSGIISDWSQKSTALVNWGAAHGLSAEQAGLKTGIFAGIAFPVLMIVFLLLSSRRKNKKAGI